MLLNPWLLFPRSPEGDGGAGAGSGGQGGAPAGSGAPAGAPSGSGEAPKGGGQAPGGGGEGGKGSEQGGQGGGGGQADPKGGPQGSWRDGIEDPELRKFAETFDTPATALKSHRELRQKLSKALFVPDDKSSEEDQAKFRKAIGVPDKPEDYGVRADDKADASVKERVGRFAEEMHKVGAPKAAVEAAYKFLSDEVAAVAARDHERRAQEREVAEKALIRDYGTADEYKRNANVANRLLSKYGDAEFLKFLGDKELDNDPRMVKFLAKAGRVIIEDVAPFGGDEKVAQQTEKDLRAEFRKREAEGTLDQPEFQRRWGKFWEDKTRADQAA
jgi:hypothetical protein